jgi:SAM-dependent methyltransferase
LHADALPPGAAPPLAPGQPVSPLSGRLPDRFLFSTPDTTGGDGAGGIGEDRPLHHVYYDSAAGAALAYPPLPLGRLNEMYAARHTRPDGAAAAVVPPPAGRVSPYAGYRGGVFGRLGIADLLARLPSPYWWFNPPRFEDATGDELLPLLAGLVDTGDASVRFLNVGCFEGALLDRLKRDTRWQTCGVETNAAAAAAARAKGHTVWEVAPQDAPLALPVGEAFDVIFLGHMAEHLPDPLLVLRRLRQLLAPGGLIVLDQPNLDSAHATLFGPTWGHWQLPYHRTLTGRRGVRRLASLADLKVVRLRTRTHPYPACVSVQLNALGLAAVVPDSARFPNDIASRGVRLTGWSRLLWDWNGRGDYLYAALKAL